MLALLSRTTLVEGANSHTCPPRPSLLAWHFCRAAAEVADMINMLRPLFNVLAKAKTAKIGALSTSCLSWWSLTSHDPHLPAALMHVP